MFLCIGTPGARPLGNNVQLTDRIDAAAGIEYVRQDQIAQAFMRLGDHERAIQWWVRGAASNVANLDRLAVDSLWNPIRPDPRIQAIMQQLKVRR
jgi:hypothetical protein